MKNFEKYERSYFMPPVPCYDWVKKDHIEKPPVWCSVDPVSYTHLGYDHPYHKKGDF